MTLNSQTHGLLLLHRSSRLVRIVIGCDWLTSDGASEGKTVKRMISRKKKPIIIITPKIYLKNYNNLLNSRYNANWISMNNLV